MIYRVATSSDLKRCFEIRGQTQDNAFNESELAAIGVTEESWSSLIKDGTFGFYRSLGWYPTMKHFLTVKFSICS